jgi:hypothetical protein
LATKATSIVEINNNLPPPLHPNLNFNFKKPRAPVFLSHLWLKGNSQEGGK